MESFESKNNIAQMPTMGCSSSNCEKSAVSEYFELRWLLLFVKPSYEIFTIAFSHSYAKFQIKEARKINVLSAMISRVGNKMRRRERLQNLSYIGFANTMEGAKQTKIRILIFINKFDWNYLIFFCSLRRFLSNNLNYPANSIFSHHKRSQTKEKKELKSKQNRFRTK